MGIVNPLHLIFLAVIALIVLGPKRLPELARSLGHGMREFRASLSEAAAGDDAPAPAPAPVAHQARIAPAVQDPAPVVSAAEAVVDPPEPVPSGDAPDSRPL